MRLLVRFWGSVSFFLFFFMSFLCLLFLWADFVEGGIISSKPGGKGGPK